MDELARFCEGLKPGWQGVKYVRIDGSTDPIERRTSAHSFRDDPSISVALLSITAAGKPTACSLTPNVFRLTSRWLVS